MTRTAAKNTYFKSATTDSKLFHVYDCVYGRCKRTSTCIILQYDSSA